MALNWQRDYRRYQRYFVDLEQFYQQKRVKTYAGIILSLSTVAFFLVFAIKPTLTTITGLLKKIKDQRMVAEKLQEKINALSQAQREYSLIENDLYLVDQALPEDAQISTLIKQLELLAIRSGVSVKRAGFSQVYLKGEKVVNPTKTRKNQSKKTQQAVGFTFTVSGSYKNLKTFLASLSSLRRIVSVESFGFKTNQEEGQLLTLNLVARAYYLKKE